MSYYSSTAPSKYSYLWSKYRPAILKLMIDSAEDPQEYKFSSHEFKRVNPKEKGGYAFILRAFQGKAENDIRTSIVAKSLIGVLKQSKTATELMDTAVYEFTLDKQFLLHITKEDAPESEDEDAVEVLDEVKAETVKETDAEVEVEVEVEVEAKVEAKAKGKGKAKVGTETEKKA